MICLKLLQLGVVLTQFNNFNTLLTKASDTLTPYNFGYINKANCYQTIIIKIIIAAQLFTSHDRCQVKNQQADKSNIFKSVRLNYFDPPQVAFIAI